MSRHLFQRFANQFHNCRVEWQQYSVVPQAVALHSCSTRGRVTLNSKLLSAPPELRREVIVEELLHLKVHNHEELFKALKRAYLAQREIPAC
jgi:predicted metal-dependent hydrolase